MSTNPNNPSGFHLIGTLHGRDPIIHDCYIPSSDGTATFLYDMVKLLHQGSDSNGGALGVCQAAATNPVLGSVLSFNQIRQNTPSNLNLYRIYRPASTAMFCAVCVDPQAIYEVQADDVGTTLDQTYVGQNVDMTVGSGSTTTGTSAMQIDSSTVGTAATLAFQIIGIEQRPDNYVGVSNQKIRVRANLHQFISNTGVTGV